MRDSIFKKLYVFSQVGLDEDSVGMLMQKLRKESLRQKGVDGYTWWRRILKYSGSKPKIVSNK